jgi:hypothetical protein
VSVGAFTRARGACCAEGGEGLCVCARPAATDMSWCRLFYCYFYHIYF